MTYLTPNPPTTLSVGIEYIDFIKHYKRQEATYLCWASCAEMILSYSGISIPQKYIVERIKGRPINETATIDEMLWATNSLLYDNNHNPISLSGQITGIPYNTVLYNHFTSVH